MKTCDHCQSTIEKDDLFCPGCGISLVAGSKPGNLEQEKEMPVKKGLVAKNILILRIVIGAIIIGAIAFVLFELYATPASDRIADVRSDNKTELLDHEIVYVEPTNYISSLDATVTDLRFFESGYDQPQYNEYYSSFARNETRYINWEIRTVHPPADEDRQVEITHIYYRSSGVIEQINKATYTFPAGWSETWQSWGYGYDQPARWTRDTYYVEILIDNVVVAAGSFEIY